MSDLLFKKLSANLDKVLKKKEPKTSKGPLMSKNSDYKSSKPIFNIGDDVATGIVILLGVIILFLLFRELLDHYGKKRVSYDVNRPIDIEKYQNVPNNSDITTTTKYKYKIPEPKPFNERDSYYDEQKTIKDIGVVRDLNLNQEYIFSRQRALSNEEIDDVISSTKSQLNSTPIVLNVPNFNNKYSSNKYKTIRDICDSFFTKIMKVINNKVTELGFNSQYHRKEDFKLLNFRIVNTLEADTAEYNKVWITENNMPIQLNRNQVEYIEKIDSNGNTYFEGVRKNNNIQQENHEFTDEDKNILQARQLNNFRDFKLDKNEFHFRIGKDLKYQTFTLYIDTSIQKNRLGNILRFNVNNIVLLDTNNQYGLMNSSVLNTNNNQDKHLLGVKGNFYTINKDKSEVTNIVKNKKKYNVFNENDIPENYFEKQFIDNELDKKSKKNAIYDDEKKMTCFGVDKNNQNIELQQYTNKMFCESYHADIDQVGIWDGPCQRDNECPFYKANKNYDNTFGGCKNGVCEMPLGINRIGYTKYSDTEPYCYNCPIGTDSKCCQQQYLESLQDNASILSPDLVFTDDCNNPNQYRRKTENKEDIKSKSSKLLNGDNLKVCPSL